MFLNFNEAIASLGEGAAFTVANTARPMGDYLFNTLLPEQNRPSYSVESGTMTVRATMAGLVAMDSPYPPSGMVEASTFNENTAKIGNEVVLSEQALRHLQDYMLRAGLNANTSIETLAEEALNFLNKVVIQPHLDTMEWLRGQALVHGAIDWTFGQKRLLVDYGIPTANLLAARAGADGYGGATSQFWADLRLLRRRLKGNIRAIIAHSETIDMIRYNDANGLYVVGEQGSAITFRRWARNNAGATQPGVASADASDTVTMIAYDKEGEMLNPADPSTTVVIPFMPRGKLLAVGNNTRNGYTPGQGSVDEDPDAARSLGYTHIAPTVEGGGRQGRWAELFTPERQPYQLNGRGVTNGLPVIEAPDKVAVATTEMV